MKSRIDLTVEPRATGKHTSRALRNDRKVPAIVYGTGENSNVYVYEGDIVRYNTRNFENALFNLKSSDKNAHGKVVLMKEVDVHPLSRRPQHVDFYALDLTKSVRVHVEIKFDGKPIGLAEGGQLNIVNRQIEIECLPTEIPENIPVDISNLGVGDAMHVSDLTIPAGLKIISGQELTIAVVNLFVEEVVAAPTAVAADATAAAAPAAGAAGAATPAAGATAAPAKDAKAAAPEKKK
ncbi:MAG: 50S ribosomal protein L25 [Bdellovibrionota bacterium]